MSLFKKREGAASVEVCCPNCGHLQKMEKHTLSAFCKRCMHRIVVSEESSSLNRIVPDDFAKNREENSRKPVRCPKCGMKNEAPTGALSVFCKKCGEIISIQKLNSPPEKIETKSAGTRTRTVRCYTCSNIQSVPLNAMSSFCSGCGNRIELTDVRIKDKCFDKVMTRGDLHVLSPGVLRADADAMNARIDGELRGNVHVEDKLVIGSKGKVFGNISAKRMEVEKGAFYRGGVRLNIDDKNYQEEKQEELERTAKKAGNFES